MSRKRCLLAVTAAGVLLLMPSLERTAPQLVWNASPSMPVGLYRVQHSAVRRGDLVLIRLPPAVAKLAHQRGYLPKSAYLIKIVLAVAGDHVCRFGTYVLVRGMFVRRALPRDRLGRRMPVWHGCRRLAGDELFVLANNPQSFDSRYFGSVSMRAVVGRAVPLWPVHR
ncbi:MAG TPA: S26 family signal peptidase [Reyranella sp.]|nr:S26 family signal peptidase [Reyranella sp.]